MSKSLSKSTQDALSTLSSREEAILKMRYGIGGDFHTLEEVGNKFELTRERIRQIEFKALGKLRHPSRTKKFSDYIDS